MPISIDIGTRNLHMVSGEAKGNRVTVDRMVIETLPTGLVQDGLIRDFSGMVTAFRNMLDRNKIRERSCIITINGNHIYTRELDVPKAVPKVLSNVITFEVQNAMNSSNSSLTAVPINQGFVGGSLHYTAKNPDVSQVNRMAKRR